MLVYFLVFLITLILQFLIKTESKKQYCNKLIISFIPLFFFGALRVGSGDYYTYENYFNEIKGLSDLNEADDHLEMGYVYLCKFLPTYRSLIIFSSFMMCFAIGRLFYKMVPMSKTWLAFLILFLAGNNTIYFILVTMRNGLAVSLLLLAFPYIAQRRYIIVALLCALATSMHTSALFAFFVAYLIGRGGNISKKEVYIWIGMIVILFFTSAAGILQMIEPYINLYLDRYDSVIREINNVVESSHTLSNIGALTIFTLLINYVCKNKLSNFENSIMRIALMFPFSYLLGVLNTRITQYFIIFYIVALTIIYYKSAQKASTQFLILFTIAFIGYAFFLWTQGTWFIHQVYHSILE